MTTKKLIENKLREFVSKVIKEELNKTKMIAYHGLSKMKADRLGYGSEISVFDTSGHWSQRVAGAYFSPFINEAKKYTKREGDKIYKVELTFNKLADRKILDEISPVKYNGETAREFLIKNGYEVPDDDWSGLLITNESNTFISKITLRRADEVGMSISLYATSPFSAGRALIAINEVIRRYKPRYVDTTVHSSNTKSIKLNSKLLGEPWGVEPKGAWNAKLGEYEDLVYFRKLFA